MQRWTPASLFPPSLSRCVLSSPPMPPSVRLRLTVSTLSEAGGHEGPWLIGKSDWARERTGSGSSSATEVRVWTNLGGLTNSHVAESVAGENRDPAMTGPALPLLVLSAMACLVISSAAMLNDVSAALTADGDRRKKVCSCTVGDVGLLLRGEGRRYT